MQRFLFDRLRQPGSPDTSGTEALRHSIQQALQRLVCNRAYFAGLHSGAHDTPSILNYGLNDLVSYGQNGHNLNLVKNQIIKMIQHYEPRLSQVDVCIHNGKRGDVPRLTISGHIRQDEITSPFSYQLALEEAGQ